MWEDEVNPNDVRMIKRMMDVGAGQVRMGDTRLWPNSKVIQSKVMEEKERRRWRHEMGIQPKEIRTWGSSIRDATVLQSERGEVDDSEEVRGNPGRILLSEAGMQWVNAFNFVLTC